MGYMRQLFESRDFSRLQPDPALVVASEGDKEVQAAKASDFMMVYLPEHSQVEVDPQKMDAKKINAWWFDPRTGDSVNLGKFRNNATYTFRTPGSSKDWVLVIDDAGQEYGAPGQVLLGMNR